MLLILAGFIVLMHGEASAQNCSQILGTIALTDPEHMIAHSIHSLTLNMIRVYFNPNATAENGIPTVNLNRSEQNHLHENAVFVNLTNSMDDYGPFFSLDLILSNMDDSVYGIKNTNIMDRIAHAMHMHHMWEHASKMYKDLVENPPESNTCTCLMDTHKEAIMKNLLIIAKLIRIPDIMGAAGKGKRKNGRRASYHYGGYLGQYLGKYIGFISKASRGRKNVEEDPSKDLYDIQITDEASWNAWKNIMKEPYVGYTEDVARDMAYFMFCHFMAV